MPSRRPQTHQNFLARLLSMDGLLMWNTGYVLHCLRNARGTETCSDCFSTLLVSTAVDSTWKRIVKVLEACATSFREDRVHEQNLAGCSKRDANNEFYEFSKGSK